MPAVTMPRLSDSMEEGTIISWFRQDGDEVSVGEELLEIETDKATVAYEAEVAGVLQIVEREGATVRVGATIANIGGAGTDAVLSVAATAPALSSAQPSAAAAAAGAAITGPSRNGPTPGRIKASPVARRLAGLLGVDLAALTGSGPAGRIVKRDVETASADGPAVSVPAVAVGHEGPKGAVERRSLSSVQATIARRMAEAKATMPEFTLTTEVDMEAAVALRAQFAELGPERPPSLGDFVLKACGLALREHPRVNSSYRDGGLELYSRVNIAVAVAATDALFVPTVFDADTKSLAQIGAETRELAERARAGRLTPPELSGATFTVSNLGMYGVTQFTAVLNPPQAAILAVGSVERRCVVQGEQLVARHRMNVTLSCDHRVLYGADAAAFLASVRANLELPLKLVL